LRINVGLVGGLILFISLATPWTITWGTSVIGLSAFSFYVLDFPFMTYYYVYSSMVSYSWWEPFNFTPRYLAMFMVILGGIFAIGGSASGEHGDLTKWGGILSILALVFFTGLRSENIFIDKPISQSYTVLPVGMFIPVIYWILILLYPSKVTTKLHCEQCGRELSPDFNLCPYCGAPLKKPTCPRCGIEISPEYIYCPSCGARLK